MPDPGSGRKDYYARLRLSLSPSPTRTRLSFTIGAFSALRRWFATSGLAPIPATCGEIPATAYASRWASLTSLAVSGHYDR